jgi:uncharacterized protein (TIGR03435 family)
MVCFAMGTSAWSQGNNGPEDATLLKFDVVSIRPSGDSKGRGFKIPPDGYEALGFPLETTLLIAYLPAPFFNHLDGLKGAPSWVGSENYDIRAKLAPADVAQWRSLNQNFAQTSPVLQRMLRQVLEERCKLRIHSVPTKTDGYVLRTGGKSAALVEDSSLPESVVGQPLSDGAVFVFATQNGERTYTFYNTSMSVLATYLTFTSQHPVEDRTGLQGRYKFVLRRLPADEDSAPPIPYDLRALGLKVDKEDVPSMIWVIDSIERPSPN